MDRDVGQNIHILSRRASNSSFTRCNGRTTKAGDTGLDGGREPWTETLRMVFRTVSEQARGPAGHSQAGQDRTDPSPNHGSLHRPGSHTARCSRLPQEQKGPLGGARVGPSTSVSQRCMFVLIWRWTTQVRSMVHFVVQHQVRTLAEGNLVEEDPADCPTHEGQHVAVGPHFAHVLPRHIDGRRHVAGPEHGGHTEDMVAKLARHGLHPHEGHKGQQESLQLANDSSQCIGQRVVGPRLGSHSAVRGQQMDKHRRGPLLTGQQHGSCIANTQWKQDVGSEGGKGQHEPSTPEQHKQFTHDDEVHACAGEQVDRQDDIPRLTTRAASVFEDAPGAALQ